MGRTKVNKSVVEISNNKVKMSVSDNREKIDKFLDEYEGESEITISVGIFSESGQDVVNRAYWNENGTSTAPARPFVLPTATRNENGISIEIKKTFRKVDDLDAMFDIIGNRMVESMQGVILSGGGMPKLSEETIRKKGHDTKLIDTGQMFDSITYKKVVK